MTFSFDLISDLHLESWTQDFNWNNHATSPWCVVAGDVCRDHQLLKNTMQHLAQCYQGVFYIDGNDEHYGRYQTMAKNYRDIQKLLKPLNNVVFLQDNVVILEDTAILGTNGWWSFDFDSDIGTQEVIEWWCKTYNLSSDIVEIIRMASARDAVYLHRSLLRLQTESVKHIVIVTHTVPYHKIIRHDIDLADKCSFNVMGSNQLMSAFNEDLANKVHTWCFGHYHGSIDQIHHGVRFVNNCRGRSNSPYKKSVFHPLRIEISD